MFDDLKVVFTIVAVMVNCGLLPLSLWALGCTWECWVAPLILPSVWVAREWRRQSRVLPKSEAWESAKSAEELVEEYVRSLERDNG